MLDDEVRTGTREILSDPWCHDFGPTDARDHVAAKHGIEVSKETLRHWMIEDKRWRAERKKAEEASRTT